jgi:chromosome segregation ATPase
MFETRKELFSKIEAQAAEITRLETELAESEAKVNAAVNTDESVAALTEDLEAAKAALVEQEASAKQEAETLNQLLAAAEAKASPETIQALVTAQIAGSGHPPLAVESDGRDNGQENSKTRAEFDAMTHAQRDEFILKQGGRIVG